MLGIGRIKIWLDKVIYENPNKAFRLEKIKQSKLPNFEKYAQSIVDDGCVIIDQYFDKVELEKLQNEFRRLIVSRELIPETKSIVMRTKDLHESALFSELGFRRDFIDFAEYYWGKPIILFGTGGGRILPQKVDKDYDSYQWHHDAGRKLLRVMILLSDVPDDGQRMDYLLGSHKIFRYKLDNSRRKKEEVEGKGTVMKCSGKAGSIVIFDTNGIHRGNRNLGPERDTWRYSYKADGALSIEHSEPLKFSPEVIPKLNQEQLRIGRIKN